MRPIGPNRITVQGFADSAWSKRGLRVLKPDDWGSDNKIQSLIETATDEEHLLEIRCPAGAELLDVTAFIRPVGRERIRLGIAAPEGRWLAHCDFELSSSPVISERSDAAEACVLFASVRFETGFFACRLWIELSTRPEEVLTRIQAPLVEFGQAGGQTAGGARRVFLSTAASVFKNPVILSMLAGLAYNISGLALPGPVDAFAGLLVI